MLLWCNDVDGNGVEWMSKVKKEVKVLDFGWYDLPLNEFIDFSAITQLTMIRSNITCIIYIFEVVLLYIW